MYTIHSCGIPSYYLSLIIILMLLFLLQSNETDSVTAPFSNIIIDEYRFKKSKVKLNVMQKLQTGRRCCRLGTNYSNKHSVVC